jgi:uncharacterized protein
MMRSAILLLCCLAAFRVQAADGVPPRAAALIASLHLQPIPDEGGWFALDWHASETLKGDALPARYDGVAHPLATVITVLETRAGFSAFHRLKTDEIWHYSDGDPIRLHLLEPDGGAREMLLDRAHPVVVVPAGDWQASAPEGTLGWSLGGTTMSPGFTPGDFLLGHRAALIRAYPKQAGIIKALTRETAR